MNDTSEKHPNHPNHNATSAKTESFFEKKYLLISIILVFLLAMTGFIYYVFLQKNNEAEIRENPPPLKSSTNLTPTIPYKEEYQNPFEKKSQYQNPFEKKEETSQNPFDNLK